MSSPIDEIVHSTYLPKLGQEKGEGNGSVLRCNDLLFNKNKENFIDRI